MGDTRHPRDDFDEAFEVQRDQSNVLANIDRSVENLDEIVAERIELDKRRSRTRQAKKRIVSRYEPPAPNHVEQPLGPQDTSRVGKIGAILACALTVVVGAVVWFGVIEPLQNPYPVEIDGVSNERVDPDAPCLWSFDVTVTNGFDVPLVVDRVDVVLNRRKVGGFLEPAGPIAPGASGVVTASLRAGTANICPTVDEIDHGRMTLITSPFASIDHRF